MKSEEGKHAQRRKAQGLAEIPEPLRALSTKQDIQVSSDPYGKSSLGIDSGNLRISKLFIHVAYNK